MLLQRNDLFVQFFDESAAPIAPRQPHRVPTFVKHSLRLIREQCEKNYIYRTTKHTPWMTFSTKKPENGAG